jgi:hypothetical protein
MAKLIGHGSARVPLRLNATLQVAYSRLDDIRQQPVQWWQDVLALIQFDPPVAIAPFTGTLLPAGADIPIARVQATVLAPGTGTAEVWRLTGTLRSGQHGRVHYRHNGRVLFASIRLSEQEFLAGHEFADPAAAGAQALRAATQAAYRDLFATLAQQGFPHLLRIWNFLPAINQECGDGERYWHFNGARQDVFLDANRCIVGNVPAATAVGAAASAPLVIYCIAGAQAPIPLENPRQRSAWAYPSQYGPRSPTFARACIGSDGEPMLFISGTASIVGHETAHEGDPIEQIRETLRNIAAVVEAANRRVGERRFTLQDLAYKVYVRRAGDQPLIERELRQVLGRQPGVLYLQADICRRDLLVEVEAVGIPGTDAETDR